MEQLSQQLVRLGLTDYEARVYGTLLQHSPSGASLIAKKCHLSRSTVYTVLGALIGKGLVATTYKNEVKQFIAEDLAVLEQGIKKEQEQLKERATLLSTLRESLPTLSQTNLHIPNILFFEGQEGLKKIYLSMMREARTESTLRLLRNEFVWQPDWKFIFGQDWHERVKHLKTEKNIQTKLLLNPSLVERKNKHVYQSKKALEYRFLAPKHAVQDFALYILGDVVSILSMEKQNLVGIKITNRTLANNMGKMFDTMWSAAKK